ncbi:hypothetical protein J1N35_015574 [Gossypium stocksii]|uniref:Reverse transcriptase zinc-binding domain-containing protein n=1 Tax=Gossypium stocksii TaxID=47602 RepID=A0A9D3VXF0_9ROSI|nr:hypothetical protein J1N35_015574 [Gossypium stocksii]
MAQFNVALLAKQGWRLITDPNSLIAQVFKAKYFPESNFLNTRLGNKSSYTWRSLWAAKGLLEKGVIWKVGTSSNDIWIPDLNDLKLSVDTISAHYDKVAELIKNPERVWNKEMINNTFRETEATLILRIPLAQEPHANFLA